MWSGYANNLERLYWKGIDEGLTEEQAIELAREKFRKKGDKSHPQYNGKKPGGFEKCYWERLSVTFIRKIVEVPWASEVHENE